MAWLAEDVMQERAWKTSVAAHLARSARSARTWLALPVDERNAKQTAAKLGAFVAGFWQTIREGKAGAAGAEPQGAAGAAPQGAAGPQEGAAPPPREGSIDAYASRLIDRYCAAEGADPAALHAQSLPEPWLFLDS